MDSSTTLNGTNPAKVAFITGGNGITGSAIAEYLANNTSKQEWSKIIVTSRSPFKTTVKDPRISFVALDFTQSPTELVSLMREVCHDVTHAYFSSYVHKDDFIQLNAANKDLFENFLDALIESAPRLQNCTLQTGGKYYNLHLRPVPSPAREDDERIGDAASNFYFSQEDYLAAKSREETWSWNVVRPEAIIGHTSKPNGMNSAITYALYFLICKELGEEAIMPTNERYWNGTDDASDARLIAEFSIWASTTPACRNQAFNIVNGDHFTWRYMWPRLAEWFGASATSEQQFSNQLLEEGEMQCERSFVEWAKDKKPVWQRVCAETGLPSAEATFDAGTWAFQDWVFGRTWTATLSMNKAREFGWKGSVDSYKSITDAFRTFRRLGQIP